MKGAEPGEHYKQRSNIMDFSTSSNVKTQNNAEGLKRKMLSTFRGRTVGVETQK